MEKDTIEVLEPKDYSSKEGAVYSHSSLVMSALRKAQDAGSKEMRDGYWNVKFDSLGNAHRVWVPDARQEFIEAIESLQMTQERDFDSECQDEINKINEELKNKFEKYCALEKIEWEMMNARRKYDLYVKKGDYYRPGMLSESLPYRFEYVRDQVKAARQIFSSIQKQIKRLGDYKEEIYEA